MNNYTEMKNATAVKAQARADVMEVVVAALIEKFGGDSVKKVGNNTYGVIVGVANDSDGCPNDVIATIAPTVKEWETRRTTKKTFVKYDLDEAAAEYQMSLDEKERKKVEAEEKKAKKIAADKAERARKAQEKADKAKAEAEAE